LGRLAIYSKVLKTTMVSLSAFGRLTLRQAQGDHGELVALRQAQGFHGELVEPWVASFDKLRMTALNFDFIRKQLSFYYP
jgi:hypothetical protein